MGSENFLEPGEVEENEPAPSQADQALPLPLFQGPRDHFSGGSDACGELIVGQPRIQEDAFASRDSAGVGQVQEEPGQASPHLSGRGRLEQRSHVSHPMAQTGDDICGQSGILPQEGERLHPGEAEEPDIGHALGGGGVGHLVKGRGDAEAVAGPQDPDGPLPSVVGKPVDLDAPLGEDEYFLANIPLLEQDLTSPVLLLRCLFMQPIQGLCVQPGEARNGAEASPPAKRGSRFGNPLLLLDHWGNDFTQGSCVEVVKHMARADG